jgi:hypothetical protein
MPCNLRFTPLTKWDFQGGGKRFANTNFIDCTIYYSLTRPLVLHGKLCFRDSKIEQ